MSSLLTDHPASIPTEGLSTFHNEPPRDFSRAEVRRRFAAELETVRRRFPIEAPLIIDGTRRMSIDRITVTSPNDTSFGLGHSASATAKDVEQAIAAARKAFHDWSRTAPGERARVFLAAAEKLRQRRDEFSAIMVFEAAKPWREADADTCEAIDFLEYYAREMLRLANGRRLQPKLLGESNDLVYRPLGITAVIGPWNFPLAIPVGMMAAAVVAGNTVVWKPAEQTPLVIHQFMELLEQCGLPPGVVNYLPGDGAIAGQALLESPDVAMVAFTGSMEVGLHILRECQIIRPGQRMVKRVVAEMGGKNALIIDASADVDAALPDILHSAFGFSGQKCSALSRLIVHEAVYTELRERLLDGVASLKIAPSWEPGCQVNPVIDATARKKIESYHEVGRSEGRLLYGGNCSELATRGHYVAPYVFEGINERHRLAQEEVFGPLLAVLKVRDFDEAIAVANSTPFALTGGVHTRTPQHLDQARREYQCGNLYLNRGITGAIVGRQPFGGFRLSGIGSKAGGPDYLRQFLVAQTVTENLMRHGFAPTTNKPVPSIED